MMVSATAAEVLHRRFYLQKIWLSGLLAVLTLFSFFFSLLAKKSLRGTSQWSFISGGGHHDSTTSREGEEEAPLFFQSLPLISLMKRGGGEEKTHFFFCLSSCLHA